MIASIEQPKSRNKSPAWHTHFMKLLPAIRKQARFAFRALPPDRREELISAVVANCVVGFVRLAEQGKQDVAFPSVLAHYGIMQTRAGRRVGCSLRSRDVLSNHAKYRQKFRVEQLAQFDPIEEEWQEVVIADQRATPAELAVFKIDFTQWLQEMPYRLRRIAKCLATGESTSGAARLFALSPGRISQLRHEFRKSWLGFQGELPATKQGITA